MGCVRGKEGWRYGWPGGWAGAPVVEECAKGSNGLELGVSGNGGDVCKGCEQEIYGVE